MTPTITSIWMFVEQNMILALTLIWMLVIALGFVFYSFREAHFLLKYRGKIVPYQELADALEKGDNESLKAYSDLALKCFVFNSTEVAIDNVAVSQKKLVLRDEIYNLIPERYISNYKFLPALLTTAGVLGTFVGISVALMGLGDISDTDKLLTAAVGLMAGMKTAFWTSVVGMATSLLFMLGLNRTNQKADQAWFALEETLIRIAAVPSQAELALGESSENRFYEKQLDVLERISHSSSDSQLMISRIAANTDKNSPEKISALIGEVVKRALNEAVVPVLEQHTLEIHNSFDKQREEFKRELFSPLAEQLNRLNSFNDRIVSSLDLLKSELVDLAQNLNQTTDVLKRFQQDTMGELLEFAKNLEVIFDDFKGSIQSTMTDITERMDRSFDIAEKGMEKQRIAFEEAAGRVATAFESQASQLELLGEKAKELMESAGQNLAEGLADLDDKIQAMSQATQVELERFRQDYQENLQQFFASQANLLEESLGQQRDGLAKVVEDFKSVFVEEHEKRLAQYAGIHSAEQSLKELLELIKATEASSVTQVAELSKNLGSQVSIMTKEYKEANASFKNLIQDMPKAMEAWFEQAAKTQNEYFSNFDDSSSKVFGHLAEIAQVLYEAASHKNQVDQVTSNI